MIEYKVLILRDLRAGGARKPLIFKNLYKVTICYLKE